MSHPRITQRANEIMLEAALRDPTTFGRTIDGKPGIRYNKIEVSLDRKNPMVSFYSHEDCIATIEIPWVNKGDTLILNNLDGVMGINFGN